MQYVIWVLPRTRIPRHALQHPSPGRDLEAQGCEQPWTHAQLGFCSCSFSQRDSRFSDTTPDRVLSHGVTPASSPRTVRGKLTGIFARAVRFSGGTARGIQTCPLPCRTLRRAERWTCLLSLGVSHWRLSTCFLNNREKVVVGFLIIIVVVYSSSCRFPPSSMLQQIPERWLPLRAWKTNPRLKILPVLHAKSAAPL